MVTIYVRRVMELSNRYTELEAKRDAAITEDDRVAIQRELDLLELEIEFALDG